MARKPAAPPPSGGAPRRRARADESSARGERTEPGEHTEPGERTERGERTEAGERFGPLTIVRVRKDDGRALILYSHEEHGQP